MKIALVSIQGFNTDGIQEETGLGIITSCLRQAGHEVLLTVINPENIALDEIVNFNPKIVGFAAYFTDRNALLKICEELRPLLKESYICAGGYLPTYQAEELLNETNNIDFVVIGEGEIVLLNVVNSIIKNGDYLNVNGVTYKRDNKIIINPRQEPIDDMNKVPYQSRDLLVKHNIKYALISGSRGCKKHCTFCCAYDFWCGWKGKSINKIVDEIQYNIAKYNVHTFILVDASFEDSNVDSKNDRVLSFANEVRERKLDISYHFSLRAESYKIFSENDIKLLKETGLTGLLIGIEAGNETDLKLYGKSATIKDGVEALKFFEEHDIYVNIGFINFNPYSTLNSLTENIDFLEKINRAAKLHHIASRFMNYKGNYLYKKLLRDNLSKGNDYGDGYGYKHVNGEIDNLARFVSKTQNEIYEKYDYGKILFYAASFKCRLENLRRRTENESILDAIKTAKSNVQNILHTINTSNAQWFRLLIELSKNWSEAEAVEITNNYLNGNIVNKYIDELQLNYIKFMKELVSADQNMLFVYENYI